MTHDVLSQYIKNHSLVSSFNGGMKVHDVIVEALSFIKEELCFATQYFNITQLILEASQFSLREAMKPLDLQVSVNRDDTVIKRATKTKLNGFMAFRAFHSREISTIEHQRGISMSLATVWASDPPSQLVWQRFAAEYNQTVRYEPDLSFVDWLLSMSKGVDSKIDEPTKRTLSRAARVENIYVEKDGNLRHNTDPYALELQNKDVNNRYHNYLKERLQSAIDRPIVTLASDPSLSRSYIDPLVYEISSGTYEKS
ncbi:Mating-type-like protein ALPHA1 [Cyberlindnera fabianii]|uniref:Mating-type-like protein ALPHA1 n=1 Tax=Cyberlindnera fabianii TaxID=36022 RepID=A0A1V2L745_CYBFA|nr:Mating-type-like protein ALPHA1 [Cyberlindnera fabianii]